MTAAQPGVPYRERRCAGLPGVAWTASRPAGVTSVLPDGCMDLIWTGHDLIIAGPDVAPNTTHVETVSTMTAVRFDPGQGPAILGVRAAECRDLRIPVAEVWPAGDVRRLTDSLHESTAPGTELMAWCRRRQRESTPAWVGGVVESLREGASVTAVARQVAMSERTLHRRAHEYFGYGPKTLARILRMRAALDRIDRSPQERDEGGLSAIAAMCGYADYAHMYREFRDLTGCAPTEFMNR